MVRPVPGVPGRRHRLMSYRGPAAARDTGSGRGLRREPRTRAGARTSRCAVTDRAPPALSYVKASFPCGARPLPPPRPGPAIMRCRRNRTVFTAASAARRRSAGIRERWSPGRLAPGPPGADPAVSGVQGSPSCRRYSSSVWPPRAAYARTPRLPTSPNAVILGITAVTVMSSPARRDSSWAYPAMNRWVALDPAYPPDVRAGSGQLGQRRAGPGDRDHRGAGRGERASDATSQAPAGAHNDGGPARHVMLHRAAPGAHDARSAGTSAESSRSSALTAPLRQLSATDCDI